MRNDCLLLFVFDWSVVVFAGGGEREDCFSPSLVLGVSTSVDPVDKIKSISTCEGSITFAIIKELFATVISAIINELPFCWRRRWR